MSAASHPPSMKLDVNRRLHESATAGISDSGYLSHATEDVTNSAYLNHETLSEQTINAMLKPHGFRGKNHGVQITSMQYFTMILLQFEILGHFFNIDNFKS